MGHGDLLNRLSLSCVTSPKGQSGHLAGTEPEQLRLILPYFLLLIKELQVYISLYFSVNISLTLSNFHNIVLSFKSVSLFNFIS